MDSILSRLPTSGKARRHDHWRTGRASDPPDNTLFDALSHMLARLMRRLDGAALREPGPQWPSYPPRNLIDDHGRGALTWSPSP
jgi:hypothetical protein